MTEIEDAVRTLLADRVVAAPPDNPARTSAVHARVRGIKRRRAASLAGGVGAVAIAAFLGAGPVSNLGRTPSQPISAPVPPPYFDPIGSDPAVPGYTTLASGMLNGEPRRFFALWATDGRPYLLVVRCVQAGTLTLTSASGVVWQVPCQTKVGARYEGAVALTGAQGTVLLQGIGRQDGRNWNLRADPGNAGSWAFGLVVQGWPSYLPFRSAAEPPPLLDGQRDATGGTFRARLDAAGDLTIEGDCIPNVVLTFTVAATPVGSVDCTSLSPDYLVYRGSLGAPRSTVTVTVRRSGLDTDQWRVTKVAS